MKTDFASLLQKQKQQAIEDETDGRYNALLTNQQENVPKTKDGYFKNFVDAWRKRIMSVKTEEGYELPEDTSDLVTNPTGTATASESLIHEQLKASLGAENYEDALVEHEHKWRRGVLPGGKYIITCACGYTKPVTPEKWQTLA